jgi:hypothetical protein
MFWRNILLPSSKLNKLSKIAGLPPTGILLSLFNLEERGDMFL